MPYACKTGMLAFESVYWINMKSDIEVTIKNCPTFLDYMTTQPHNKVMPHEIPWSLWESIGTDIFTINRKHYLCTVDYHSKFPVMKQVVGFSTDNLIKLFKIIFSEYRLLSKIVSDADTNIIKKSSKTSANGLPFNM